MKLSEHITEIIAFLGGGGAGVVTNYFLRKKEAKKDEFVVLLESYKELYHSVVESEKECKYIIERLNQNIIELREKIARLETIIEQKNREDGIQ
jgi:phospholipid N-methyltransferase